MKALFKATFCYLVGHRWDWPDIVTTIRPEGLRFLPQWRQCGRCGHREQDENHEARILILPEFQGNPDACSFSKPPDMGLQRLGNQVNQIMGWER